MVTIVEFYGGPGCGKTTTASGLWSYLKGLGVKTEFVRETAQDEIFTRKSLESVSQIYLVGNHIQACADRSYADVIVTDTGLKLNAVYADPKEHKAVCSADLVYRQMFNVLKVYIHRNPDVSFSPDGRIHTHEESVKLDYIIREKCGPFDVETGCGTALPTLWSMIYEKT